MPRVTSVIEITTEDAMPRHRRRKHRYRNDSNGDTKESKSKNTYRSEAKSDKNRFFHNVKGNNNGVSQNVKVDVKVESEDCFTGIIKALGGCFGKGG